MTITINRSDYINLLNEVRIVPKVIETEIEYDRFLTVVEGLLSKRQSRTPAETALFVLLVKLVEDYEQEHHSLTEWCQEIAPHKFLQHMMEARELEQNNLMEILNISQEIASSIFSGNLQVDRAQAQNLANYFKVSPSNFLTAANTDTRYKPSSPLQ